MSKLTYAKRKKLKTSSFAIPSERAYPINDQSHARNALARASEYATPSQQTMIKRKVKAKYPSIGK